MRLADRVAIVTGSTRGLGRHLAILFAREGARVVVTGRSQTTGALSGTIGETVRTIDAAGGHAIGVPCDLAIEEDIQRLVRTALDQWGRIDVIVNNAVARVPTRLIDTVPSDMEMVLRVNLLGAFHLCRLAIPGMMERRHGTIITIKSSDSLQPGRDRELGNAPYRVSKAALTMFTVELAAEVSHAGVAVNAFYPGRLGSAAHAAMRRERAARYGTQVHVVGDPPSVCDEPILFLATQPAASFSGQIVRREDFGTLWGPGIQHQEV
jgi:NAD(P)-dependent dehydrogenase (short-subunit alcohol dehydrogenase family)